MGRTFVTLEPPPALAADTVTRLGLIVLATDLTIEANLAAMLPPGAALHATRVAYANPTTPENLRRMAPQLVAAAALLVPGIALAAIGYGCTSGGVVIGDARVAAEVGAIRPGVPVLTPALAAVRAFRALGVQRIALLTPYVAPTTAPMIDYFEAAGLAVVQALGLGLEDDRDIARLPAAAIGDAVRQADHPAAEALFVACTAVPILGLIARIEADLGKPVLGANQALGWAMLRAAGLPATGPGLLFGAGMAP